jgi:dolichol-phosphate mannosyltransferase
MSGAVPQPPSPRQRRRRHVWVVLPAYNEEQSLPALLERIDDALFEANLAYCILLLDDGSQDRTAAIAEQAAERLPLLLERHPVNLGLGAAIRDGLMKACELADPRDILVTMDADNSHSPELILRLVRAVREGHDVVIASRYRPGSRVRGVPLARRLLSYWGSWLFRILFPIPGVRDYTCGYRAYRAALLQSVVAEEGSAFFDQDGFQAMVDILLKLRRRESLLFGEVPLILRYDFKEGASKMDVGRTLRNTLALMAKRRFGGR